MKTLFLLLLILSINITFANDQPDEPVSSTGSSATPISKLVIGGFGGYYYDARQSIMGFEIYLFYFDVDEPAHSFEFSTSAGDMACYGLGEIGEAQLYNCVLFDVTVEPNSINIYEGYKNFINEDGQPYDLSNIELLTCPFAKDQESNITALKEDRDDLFSDMKIVEVQQIDVSQPQTFSLKCKIFGSNTEATAGGSTSYGNLTFSSETSEGTKVKFECRKESVDGDGIYTYSCTTDRGFNGKLEGVIGSFQEDDTPLILHFPYESGNITNAESNPDQPDEHRLSQKGGWGVWIVTPLVSLKERIIKIFTIFILKAKRIFFNHKNN